MVMDPKPWPSLSQSTPVLCDNHHCRYINDDHLLYCTAHFFVCVSGVNPLTGACTGANVATAADGDDCCDSPINAAASLLYVPVFGVESCAQCAEGKAILFNSTEQSVCRLVWKGRRKYINGGYIPTL